MDRNGHLAGDEVHAAMLHTKQNCSLTDVPEELRAKPELVKAFIRGQLTRNVDSHRTIEVIDDDKSKPRWQEVDEESRALQRKMNEEAFSETSWQTETVLSWLAFGDVARFHQSWRAEKWYGELQLADQNPRRTLLDALRLGTVSAFDRLGNQLSAEFWLHVCDWRIDCLSVHFRRVDILAKWQQRGRKKTGPKSAKLETTVARMKEDIKKGRETPEALSQMTQEALAAKYEVSRDTACKARDMIVGIIETGYSDKK